jgi:hypothetical protein
MSRERTGPRRGTEGHDTDRVVQNRLAPPSDTLNGSGPFVAEGVVRGLIITESPQAGRYARVRLARENPYYHDFDCPDDWDDLRGARVWIWWEPSIGSDGMTYRRVLDFEEGDE